MGVAGAAQAIDVWLDWAGSDATMNSAWTAGGFNAGQALTAAERNQIRAGAQAAMAGHYAGFNVNLTTTQPGGTHEVLRLGATTTTQGLFGQASRIDWRNVVKTDSADIYLANFGILLNATNWTRAENLTRLALGIGGTSSHELGHNLGLQHYDCYGQPSIKAPLYGGITGQQNDAIMATGSTGLSLQRRGEPRSFAQLEKLKLEYADGVSPTLGLTVAETAANNNALGSAQQVAGNFMALSGLTAVNIRGAITTSADIDFYRFSANAGQLITANTFSQNTFGDPVDTIITLMDANGNTLMTNDDIAFSGNTFGGSGTYGTDSIILNYVAPATGNYYVRVTPFSTGSGDYDLLLATSAVPEPATLAALGLGTLALLRRRRRAA